MDEKLKSIESQLYKSELTFPFLKERLTAFGEVKAWYRFYRAGNEWPRRFFKEENIFLMDEVIIWNHIADNGQMGIHCYQLHEITDSDRNYGYPDKKSRDRLVLTDLTLTFRSIKEKGRRDRLVMKRPLPKEQGDPEGFDNFASLLQI